MYWVHCKDSTYAKNSKQIIPEIKLHCLIPSSYIHASVSDVYIPTIGLPILLQKNIGGPIVGIYKSLTETGTEGTRFLFWEHINRIFFAVPNKKCDLEDAGRELNAVLNG
jgi:hypothetical protein